MMTMEDKRILIDTNVLIYANVSNTEFKDAARQKLLGLKNEGCQLFICTQIIREYLVFLTRFNTENKIAFSNSESQILSFFNQFEIIPDSVEITKNLIRLISKHNLTGKIIHDANIVSSMQCYNIKQVLTHNVDDFKRFDEIKIIPLI